jgi:hypothetical protein
MAWTDPKRQGATVIVEFRDGAEKDEHARFQGWRRANNDGFFLNCKSRKDVMLHKTLCPHSGDTDWEKGEAGSLTSNRKICSEIREELVSWARRSGVRLSLCNDCKP